MKMSSKLSRRSILAIGVVGPLSLCGGRLARAAEQKQFTFTATPVNNSAQGKKLTNAIQTVPEVHSYSLASGEKRGTATVRVGADLDDPQPIIDAANRAGFTVKLTETGGGKPDPNPDGKSKRRTTPPRG